MVESSFIKGEERLLAQAVNKITIDKEDGLPTPDEVLPIEPHPSRIEIPERSSQRSMLKDDPVFQVAAAAPSDNVVNTKQLPNNVAVSIKNSRRTNVRIPSQVLVVAA